MATTYREIEATPSSTGGRDGGKVHRLYESQPTREEVRALRQDGWRVVDLTSGYYAHTTLAKEAMKVSSGAALGQIFTK